MADALAMREVIKAKDGARLRMWLEICARCGLCAKGCHFYQSDPKPEHVPAYRLKPLLKALKEKDKISDETLAEIVAVDYGTCTMCQRCAMYCPFGINIAFLVRAARSIAVSQGLTPPGLAAGIANYMKYGSNLEITEEEFVETVQWQVEELQAEMPQAQVAVDKAGAKTLLTFHPRDIKFYPQNLYNYFKLYNAAQEDFTVASFGFDSTNVGLFAGDDKAAAHIASNIVNAAERLDVKEVITAE